MELGGDSFGGKSGKFWIPHGDVKEAVHVWLGQLLFYDKHLLNFNDETSEVEHKISTLLFKFCRNFNRTTLYSRSFIEL